MRIDRDNRLYIMACLFSLLVFAMGCGKESTSGNISGGRDVMRLPGAATAGQLGSEGETKQGIRAIVTAIDTDKQVITLKVIDKRSVELNYTGATDIRNSENEVMSASQLEPGEVVYADYNAGINKLNALSVSSDGWKEEVSGVKIDTGGSYIEYGKQKYTYDKNLVVMSGTSKCKLEDIELIDHVLIRGKDKKIDSMVVTRGHGYLQLENTAFYEGGIIEVGTEVITGILANMRLLVPEGTFRLTVTKGKDSGSGDITIERNGELTVNLAEFQKTGERYGNLGFEIRPEGANLFIDRKKIDDYSGMVEAKYGEHEIIVTAQGYKPYTGKIKVDSVYQPVVIELEASEQTSDNKDAKEPQSSKDKETKAEDRESENEAAERESSTRETTAKESTIPEVTTKETVVQETTAFSLPKIVADLFK